jgi:hypothetical protein
MVFDLQSLLEMLLHDTIFTMQCSEKCFCLLGTSELVVYKKIFTSFKKYEKNPYIVSNLNYKHENFQWEFLCIMGHTKMTKFDKIWRF